MRLTNHVAERIARRMRLDGFTCEEADVWKVYEVGTLDGAESLGSRILNEFDEYGVEVHTEEDMVAQALQNASRFSADSSSRKWLRRAIEKPSVLDYLERCVFEERERRV